MHRDFRNAWTQRVQKHNTRAMALRRNGCWIRNSTMGNGPKQENEVCNHPNVVLDKSFFFIFYGPCPIPNADQALAMVKNIGITSPYQHLSITSFTLTTPFPVLRTPSRNDGHDCAISRLSTVIAILTGEHNTVHTAAAASCMYIRIIA